MAHRLSKIYTRTGDDGSTSLGDGTRVRKDCLRLEARGSVEELNASIGLVLSAQTIPRAISQPLMDIQHHLYDICVELSIPSHPTIKNEHILHVERLIELMDADLPNLREFELPGGSPGSSTCYLARSICRRAERHLARLSHHQPINPHLQQYLNRLGDLLLVCARLLVRTSTIHNSLWQKNK